MSGIASDPNENATKLLPYQATFAESVLSPESKQVVLLRGDVGLGKTQAIATALVRLLRERPRARVLVLCPTNLRSQWAGLLKRDGILPWTIDRYRFREMAVSNTDGEMWPVGVAVILSHSFARQTDIRDSLTSVHWDLVVVDEAHRFSGIMSGHIKYIAAKADRVVLAALPGTRLPHGFTLEDATVVDWRRNELVDDKGKLLWVTQRPVLFDVRFLRNNAERDLQKRIKALCEVVETETPQPTPQREFGSEGLLMSLHPSATPLALISPKSLRSGSGALENTLLKSLHSSPVALEVTLRWLASGSEMNDQIDTPLLDDDGVEVHNLVGSRAAEERTIAGQALQVLETLQDDSKLEAFGNLVAALTQEKTPSKRICVLTDYLSTLYYLAAEIEGRDVPYVVINHNMPMEAREKSRNTFEKQGGTLLVTRAVISEGLDVSDVTDLVLYDVPPNKSALHQLFGRLNGFRRTGRLTIHALAPEDSSDGLELAPLRLLHEMYE